jgi:hypothetical protein
LKVNKTGGYKTRRRHPRRISLRYQKYSLVLKTKPTNRVPTEGIISRSRRVSSPHNRVPTAGKYFLSILFSTSLNQARATGLL